MTLKVLLVDDEALARMRLRDLLADCSEPAATVVGEAAQAQQALDFLGAQACDLVLLDIHMPGMDGLKLAQAIRSLAAPPAVVFVTAHAEHALQAFDLEAVDYLTKPVRRDRLQQALAKALRWRAAQAEPATEAPDHLLIQDRGRIERVPVSDVVYLKAELKYVTVRTRVRSHIYDGSLSDLESRFPERFVRVHRNALVARAALRALERHHGGSASGSDGEGWEVALHGVDERLAVSRRQLPALREVVQGGAR
ncbi:LytR/AlgR family response regulator transcription factor [Hydrogenophaga sp. OTU3427]|uniref:LytR/AlgR family response regulator transcription factor n=1 Tax=Hydrogenophaga sp. OTU3427 TaxID=3043856 RepID=UPI00313B5B22